MVLAFDIQSSITFWRRHYPLNRAPDEASVYLPSLCPPTLAEPFAHNETEIVRSVCGCPDALFRACDGKWHVLVQSKESLRNSRKHAAHIMSGPLPHGSFYEYKPGVLVESPPFMLMRAASLLNFSSLIAFGNELCGLYSFDSREKRGFRKRREPLATKAQLERYLASAVGCRGHKRAVAALPHIVEKCASPMETYDEMTMALPYKYGGYGIYRPEMNLKVPLTPKAARIAKRQNCYLDMSWNGIKLDVEHHGKLDHSSAEDRASDRARVNALEEMGYEVIELTYDQVDDLVAYEHIICRIARILGKRLHKQNLGPTPERIALRRALKEWNSSSGAIL